MLKTITLVALTTTMALPASVLADPPMGSWDRDGESAPPAPSAPPPSPGAAPPAPNNFGRSRSIDAPRRRRRVIHRRRRKIDFSSLRARNYGEKITIGIFTGMKVFSDNAQIGNSPDMSIRAKSGVSFGLRTGYNITRLVGIQGEVNYQPTSYFADGGTAHLLGLRGFLMLHLPWRAWRPFLLVGGGVEMLPHNVDGVEIDYDGAFIGGLGAKFDLSDATSLRFDVRGLSTDGVVGGTLNWEAHIGLTFRFMVQ